MLNNMVAELLNVTRPRADAYELMNPRDGWVFFSSTAKVKAGDISIWLESDPAAGAPVLLHAVGDAGTVEAMRFLPAGRYRLSVRAADKGRVRRLVVRAVPEIAYCYLPVEANVKEFGPYDRAFLAKDVLPNVNCMISNSYSQFPKTKEFQDFARRWRQSGRKWIARRGGIPGIHAVKEGKLTVEKAFSFWARDGSWKDPLLDGIIVDEFGGGNDERFAVWGEAVKRLHAAFPGRSFYPFSGVLCSAEPGKAFAQELMKAGDRFAYKRYLKEQPTKAEAHGFLDTAMRHSMATWREVPGAEGHVLFCFGHLMSAPPETLSANPNVDFKVYMDMQFNLLANAPVCRGVGGVMEYHAQFADEEYIRWAGRLFRHYGIEGKTEMLSKEYGYRYRPDHIQNADFDRGTKGWTLAPAEEGSMTIEEFPGLGWMQGRYPRGSEGDRFLVMRRSGASPNVLSQRIRNLRRGELYSIKMLSGDYDDLVAGKSASKKLGMSIEIEGGVLVPEMCIQNVFMQWPGHYAAPFTRTNRFSMNFHRYVFRARRKTATLRISDWAGAGEPGGPAGQAIACNFIEVQAYLAP